ncbi:hypothetical protein GCM10008023_09280 [Sphingomonas glacialis]|uniref:Cbb3-type cytochrome c oxidase subunit I n=1 Tax=Sphingomonas glacialis TaxID=658225 RepID=A0ABQ3LB51_9SPHN|nr:hypothetical protein [Sphingomonas glacialis]GHH10899.1 hypothetical protein GCM10008023_09280 [Sphingomonas glacialis]
MPSNTDGGQRRISQYFFCLAALCGLGGMGVGALMGLRDDYTLIAAHAHLNLLGWVTLALMGGYYRHSPARPRWSFLNLLMSGCGGLVLPLAHALRALGSDLDWVFKLGATTALAGMALFLGAVILDTRGKPDSLHRQRNTRPETRKES